MCVMSTVGESAATWPRRATVQPRALLRRGYREPLSSPLCRRSAARPSLRRRLTAGVRRAGQPHDLGVAVAEALEVERLSLAGLEGLSRRRSRVRVPSLPYREALQARGFSRFGTNPEVNRIGGRGASARLAPSPRHTAPWSLAAGRGQTVRRLPRFARAAQIARVISGITRQELVRRTLEPRLVRVVRNPDELAPCEVLGLSQRRAPMRHRG